MSDESALAKVCADCGICEQDLAPAGNQPPMWEHRTVDGVFIKQMFLKDEGTIVPQHSHLFAHTSMLATGSVRVWVEGELLGDFKAPRPLFIEARKQHTFRSLEPNTLLYCIHNVAKRGVVQIHREAASCPTR